MKRQTVLVAVCGVLFLGTWAFQDGEKEANGYPVVDAQPIVPILHTPEIVGEIYYDIEDTQTVAHQDVCVAGNCGPAMKSSTVSSSRRWTPIRNVASRRAGNRWYPGKNLGRLFGRRR